jgi:folate-binding protein YgfZ
MTARAFHATDRALIEVTGEEARSFLQGIVTNDIRRLDHGAVYAALLSPQGKYLFDFIISERDGAILLDVKADRAEALAARLSLYRLRAKVAIAPSPLAVIVGLGAPAPEGALADPRETALGWRLHTPDPAAALARLAPLDPADWHRLRIAHAVPETGIELLPEETYILEAGFERLGGVDFRKGCYVGQEVTARMKHKTELKKGLVEVAVEGDPPPPGTPILAGERAAGTLFSVAEGRGLAHLRFDRATGELRAGTARISRIAG